MWKGKQRQNEVTRTGYSNWLLLLPELTVRVGCRNGECKRKQPASECDSATGQHLSENDQCVPIATMINSLLWTLRTVLVVSVCSKPATVQYGDLIYANRKSLFLLLHNLHCLNTI